MIELELGNKEDLLAKGREKREQTMPEKGQQGFQRVLSENDNTQPPPKPHNTQKAIAKAAGVSTGQVGMAERDKRIFDLWMQCWTQEQIADAVGCSQSEADRCLKDFSQNGDIAKLGKTHQAAAEHATDFDVPIYNIWKQQSKTESASRFGNSEVRRLDNLWTPINLLKLW